MKIRLTRFSLLLLLTVTLIIGTLLSITGGTSFAQEDAQDSSPDTTQIYLPMIAAQGDDASLSATPAVIIAADRWLPIATATPTMTPVRAYPDWVPGTYNIRLDAREGWATYHADGTFVERFATFGTAEITSAQGTWFVSNGQLYVEFVDQAGIPQQRHFLIETVDDGFRLAGGDARLNAYLYERREPTPAVDLQDIESYVVSQWMRGKWRGSWGLTTYEFYFHESGRYEVYEQEGSGEPVEEGRWSAWADKLIMQPTGAEIADSTYTIASATQDFVSISDGRYGESDFGLLRESYTPPASMHEYDGQYIADGVTITVQKGNGGGAFQPGIVNTYSAEMIADGNVHHFGGLLSDDGRLILTSIGGGMADGGTVDGGTVDGNTDYEPLRIHLNGLHYPRFELPEWLPKVSETALPAPETIHGLWVRSSEFSDESDLWLLPDQRYVSIHRFAGETYQTAGEYTLVDDQIIFDAHCGVPSSYAVRMVGNQLVLRDAYLTLTYHYVPGKLSDLVAALAQQDEVDSRRNADFAGQAFLTQVTADDGMSSLRDAVDDPAPNYRFPDATVFGRPAGFTLSQESSYYKNQAGALVAVTPLDFLLNYPIVDTIDFTQSSWQDRIDYTFYPNGRFLVYRESYADAFSLDPVMPRIERSWGRYTVENETIRGELADGTSVDYALTLGRQRFLQNQQCFDNVERVRPTFLE